MNSNRGGSRPGAGRKRGSKNRRTLHVEEQLERLNMNPIEAMVDIYNMSMKAGDLKTAGMMAKELAQYYAPKRRAIEVDTGDKTQEAFIAALHAGRERVRRKAIELGLVGP